MIKTETASLMFVKNYLYPTFKREGLDAKIMIGESGFWSDSVATLLLNDESTQEMVDIVTAHQYQGSIKDFPTSREKGRHLWMSELCDTVGKYHVGIDDAVGWGKIIHEFMTIPQANAFLYWRGVHTTNTNQTMIRIDSPTSYTVITLTGTEGSAPIEETSYDVLDTLDNDDRVLRW